MEVNPYQTLKLTPVAVSSAKALVRFFKRGY